MRARARVEVAYDGEQSRLVTLRSEPPLTVRATPGGVHLVGSAAGPIGGDALRVDVEVHARARLAVRSAAATVALPGPSGAPSTMAVYLVVGEGAVLDWLPDPLVAVRECDHRSAAVIDLAAGAALSFREEFVFGRHNEPSGSVRSRLRVDRDRRPLYRNELVVGPRWPGSEGPSGTGGARAFGSLLTVGPGAASVRDSNEPGLRRAVMRLAPDVTLMSVLADRAGAVRAALDAATPRSVPACVTAP